MPTVSGKAMWASITQPNTTYEPVWSINLVVDEATAKEFTDKGFGSSVVKKKPPPNYRGGIGIKLLMKSDL